MNFNAFEQIYINSRRNQSHYRMGQTYLYELRDQIRECQQATQLLIVHLMLTMSKSTAKTWEEVQTVTLNYNDEETRKQVTSNKNNFYQAIKDLVDMKILLKQKPGIYVVNPYYMCFCSKEQMRQFRVELEQSYHKIQSENLAKHMKPLGPPPPPVKP